MGSELIVFDCDGVLVDSEPLSEWGYRNVFESRGIHITPQEFSTFVGKKQKDILDGIEAMKGYRLPEAEEGVLWQEIKRLLTEHLKPTNGIIEFLNALKTPKCVASSSSMERIQLSLQLTGIEPFFGPHVFSSSMVKNGKPAPDLFLYAAEKRAALPQNCVVIEDSPYGIAGARAAGMVAIGYVGGQHIREGHAERLIAAGAHAVHNNWTDIARELSAYAA